MLTAGDTRAVTALMEAMRQGDDAKVEAIWEDISSIPPAVPRGEFAQGFPLYNAQVNRAFTSAAGYITAGPMRAPYRDLPEDWARQAELHPTGWVKLRVKYARSASSA